jgi:Predicted secreted endonuclease distantly related to archaeal Holliday junction resolvase
MLSAELIGFFILVLMTISIGYLIGRKLTEARKRAEIEKWKVKWEKSIRADAVKKSRAVVEGRVTEQLAPYLPDFGYKADDARFLGSPVDLVIFDGLSLNDPTEIVFIEVKKGSSTLSPKEKKIKALIEEKRVRWELYRIV